MQFLMTAYNFLKNEAAFLNTGTWSKKAIKEAKIFGKVDVLGSSEDENFNHIPKISIDKECKIKEIQKNYQGADYEQLIPIAIPGIPNAHSHAFQYAMAGMTENHPLNSQSDFWSWRKNMYDFALNIDPDDLQNIATMLYSEMLSNGYTHVAEFHYLHHDKKFFLH